MVIAKEWIEPGWRKRRKSGRRIFAKFTNMRDEGERYIYSQLVKAFRENINRGCRDYLDRISEQRMRVDKGAINLQWVHEQLHSPCNVGKVALLTNVARFAHLSISTGVSASNHDFDTGTHKTPPFKTPNIVKYKGFHQLLIHSRVSQNISH